ncbi:MAG TPA: PAS domain S-box protein [Methylomirabilota bacterium]|nr:PAS domain S-box protein [Methylomirabilota bacterium]
MTTTIGPTESLLNSQKQLLAHIVNGADLSTTLEVLTRALEANAQRPTIATIMLVSSDQQYLYPAAGDSAPPGWRAAIAKVAIAPNSGSCGSSAFCREPVISPDIAVDSRWAAFREAALQNGLRACWSSPILSSDQEVLGTFAIYYREPTVPTPDEMEMVEIMTRSAAVAIQSSRLHSALQKELLLQQESAMKSRLLAAIVQSSDDAIIGLNLDTTITTWNQGAERIFGYTVAEAVGKSVTMLIPPGMEDEEPRIIQRLLAGERVEHYETVRKRKDGAFVNVSLTVSPIYDDAGKIIGASKISRDITRQLEAEMTRNRMAAIVESSDDAIIGLSLDTTITSWNRGAERIFGYSVAEAVGRSVTMLIPDGLEDEEPRILQRLKNGERVEHYETIRKRKDGSIVDVSLTVSPVHDAAGTLVGASKISRDITESKRQQEALRRSEEELRAMANSIPQLAWMAHPDGFIYWYNQRWYDYTGTTREGMEGWGWQSVHDPEYLPKVLSLWTGCVQRAVPFEMEFPLRGADGVFRWFLTRVNPFKDKAGNVVRWFGTNTEVDELRRTQQALKEQTRALEVLNDTSRSIASELNLERIVQSVTDSATKLTGAKFGAFFYSMQNEQGESFMLFTLSGAPRESFERFGHPRATPLFAPTFRGEPPIRSDDILKDPRYGTMSPHQGMPKGHLPVRSYLAVPVISRSGEVIGGLFFGHPDVGVFTAQSEALTVGLAAAAAIAIDNARLFSQLQETRDQLARHNERLEEQVAERTAALQETIQDLEAFSYSVSHDMRSPLRAMQGYSDALLTDYKERLDATAVNYLSRIQRAAKRMDLLIQDVLAYSKVAKGDIQLSPINMEAIISDVIQNYPALQPDRAAINIVRPLPKVLGHEAYLTQVVSNLLGNAVKFMEPGVFPTVEITATEDGPDVRIAFRDNGIGIDPEQQKHIFQIFGRVYPEKKFEGTGIGLAIVKKAVERMGGSVGVNSKFGSGSEFHVTLRKA